MKEAECSKLILNEGAKYNMSLVFSSQLQRQTLEVSTWTSLANIATVMKLKGEILKNTKCHCMKMSNFLVLIELMKLPQMDHLEKSNVGVIYPCKHCSYELTQKAELKGHQKLLHEDVKFPCTYWSYQATTKGSLGKFKVGVIYPC